MLLSDAFHRFEELFELFFAHACYPNLPVSLSKNDDRHKYWLRRAHGEICRGRVVHRSGSVLAVRLRSSHNVLYAAAFTERLHRSLIRQQIARV